jgi:hypothetical protein
MCFSPFFFLAQLCRVSHTPVAQGLYAHADDVNNAAATYESLRAHGASEALTPSLVCGLLSCALQCYHLLLLCSDLYRQLIPTMIAFARAKRIDKVIDLFEDTISNLAVASPFRRADEEDPRTSIPRYLSVR